MERLNRQMQRELLDRLADAYPLEREPAEIGYDPTDPDWNVNVRYLAEHRLVEVTIADMLDIGQQVVDARITAAGLDFLQADGGLTAILGVLTVRLDAETIRALIEEKIEATLMPAEEKSRLMRWVATAGTEALKEATKRLLGAALDHAPQALQLLQTLRD